MARREIMGPPSFSFPTSLGVTKRARAIEFERFSEQRKEAPAEMRNLRLRVLLVGLVLTSLLSGQSFPWNDFKPRTLKDIIQQSVEAAGTSSGDKLFLWKDILSSRVGVTYGGQSRAIPPERRDFIARWARSVGIDAGYASRYETEILFSEEGKEYWLPTQKAVIPYLEKEVTRGQMVDLYLVRAGGRRARDQWDWVLLVEEFQKPKPR